MKTYVLGGHEALLLQKSKMTIQPTEPCYYRGFRPPGRPLTRSFRVISQEPKCRVRYAPPHPGPHPDLAQPIQSISESRADLCMSLKVPPPCSVIYGSGHISKFLLGADVLFFISFFNHERVIADI